MLVGPVASFFIFEFERPGARRNEADPSLDLVGVIAERGLSNKG